MKTALKIVAGLAVVAFLAAGGVFGTEYFLSSEESASQDGEQQGPTRVGTATPEMREIEDVVTAVGTIKPIRSVMLVPNTAGRVTDVPVTSGERVEAGALVVQFDNRTQQAALDEAEATLEEARRQFARIEELEDRNTAAESRLDEVRANRRRAEAAAMRAQAEYDDRAVTTPFAGTLGIVDTEPGAFLDPSEAVTRLSDLSVVEVDFTLPERYFDRISEGQTVLVTTPAYPDTRFEGRVTIRATEIDPATRSVTVRAQIDNADGSLVGGMFANARLVLDTYEGLAIPDDAIIDEGLTSFVYTVSEGKARRIEIEPGTSLGELTEIRDGLSGDAQVIVSGWDGLTGGTPVEVAENVPQEGLE